MNAYTANSRTSAKTVTPGQARAMMPTTTLRMPSRINEVDVDLDMKGIPFRLAQPHHGVSCCPRCCQHQQTAVLPIPANTCRLWIYRCRLENRSAGCGGRVGFGFACRAPPEVEVSERARKQRATVVHDPVDGNGKERGCPGRAQAHGDGHQRHHDTAPTAGRVLDDAG